MLNGELYLRRGAREDTDGIEKCFESCFIEAWKLVLISLIETPVSLPDENCCPQTETNGDKWTADANRNCYGPVYRN